MKLKFLNKAVIAALILGTTVLYSCKQDDSKIRTESQAKVTTIDSDVNVDVADGVVTLTGVVDDEAAKSAVAEAVKDVKGVKSVVNNTTVGTPDVMVNSDEELKTALDRNFTAKGVQGVNFTVVNGEVTLTGDVDRADLPKVMQAANESNPKKVINNLNIKN
ncbi:MAG: BON domain-containing protein [Daejeonella sp.]